MLKLNNFNKFIIANWKLYGSPIFVKKYINNIKSINFANKNDCVVICPPFPLINFFNSNKFLLGAQNCSTFVEGPYTGEISAKILKSIGCKFCIIGHSERRSHFNESNEMIYNKIINCLNEDIIPILCIGETLKEKKENQTKIILKKQIEVNIPQECNFNNLIIAYEPLWSIGSGLTPTIKEINDINIFLKKEVLGSVEFKILYGGSVKSSNSKEILSQDFIDGVLVGSASINIEEFNKIIKY